MMPFQAMRMRGAGSVTFATWSASDGATQLPLGVNNRQVSAVYSALTAGFYYLRRATMGKSSGKWYWETTVVTHTSGNTFYVTPALVLSSHFTTSPDTATYPGLASDSIGGPYIGSDGNTYKGGVGVSVGTGSATIRHRLDMDAGTYSQAKDGGSFVTVATGLTGTYYPAIFARKAVGYTGTMTLTSNVNFGQNAFTYSVPSGYNPGVYT